MNKQIQLPEGAPLFNPLRRISLPILIRSIVDCARPIRCTLTPLGFHVASRHADVSAILRDKHFGKDFIGRITRRSGPHILRSQFIAA